MKKSVILETKLTPPDCSSMLPRMRLIDDFRQSDRRLTVLCADAGYGKTILMGQFYQSLEGSEGVWYQFSSADKVLAVFLEHLLEGVSRRLPGFGTSLKRELQERNLDFGKWENYLTLFINELRAATDEPLVFYFDEFQRAKDFDHISDALQFLIAHLPPDFRVVIASRERPSLSLGRLRTQRKLKEIGSEDLRFTIEEMDGVFSGCCGAELGEEELKVWHKATAGWPVAVVLARRLLTVDRRLPVDVNPELMGVHGDIAGYLAEEIWSEVADEIKQFLMETSLLETVEVQICDQALSAGEEKINSARLLQTLEERNLMIFCIEEGKSYAYQPLVRQFLRSKLEQDMTLPEIDALNLRFGQAYADHKHYDLAIFHFLEGQSLERAVGVIEKNGDAILEAGHYDALAEWLAQIPHDTIRTRPRLAYYAARSSERQGNIEHAVQWYETAADGFAREGDSDGLFACALAMAEFYFMRDMHYRSLEKATESLKWAATPEQKVKALSRMAAQNLFLGYAQDAKEFLEQANDLCDPAMVETRFSIEVRWLFAHWLNGEFLVLHDKVIVLQREQGIRSPMFLRSRLFFLKFFSLYEMGRYEDALSAIEERSEYLGDGDLRISQACEYLRGVVLLNFDDGKTGQMIIEALDKEVGDSRVIGPGNISIYLGSYFRRKGDLDKAIKIHSMYLGGDGGNQYSTANCLVNIGADRLRQKHNDPEGIRNLEEAQVLATRQAFNYISTQVYFNLAWVALAQGDDERALKEIEKALKLASLYQHNNYIIQEGRISTSLLAFAFGHDIEREYLVSLLPSIGPVVLEDFATLLKSDLAETRVATIAALKAAGGISAAPYIRQALRDSNVSVRREAHAELRHLRLSIESPEDILTRRENQVMELIAEGMSNAEIAQRLYISEPTIKTHISRIFRKLGLTSRSQVAAIYQQKKDQS